MADITKGYNFGATEAVTNTKLSQLVDDATLSNVVIADLPYKDEDDMASDSATHVPTQQSVKAYVDNNAGGATAVEVSFANADLSTGVLTVTHNLGLAAGYTAIVTIVNNSGAVIIPDAINTFATNSFKVDLTSYGTLTGTWYCIYITK